MLIELGVAQVKPALEIKQFKYYVYGQPRHIQQNCQIKNTIQNTEPRLCTKTNMQLKLKHQG